MNNWFKSHIPVLEDSRWIMLFKGEIQIWRVTGFGVVIKNKIAEITTYRLVRDDLETDEVKLSPYRTIQSLIAEKAFINVGNETKEQYISRTESR